MPKNERLTAKVAVALLEENGFIFARESDSHAQYYKNDIRVTIPIHGDKILHKKVVGQVKLVKQQYTDQFY